MSFLRRLILAISLLMLLGVPLSAMYYEPARMGIGLRNRTTRPPRARKPRGHLCRRNRKGKMRADGLNCRLMAERQVRFSAAFAL